MTIEPLTIITLKDFSDMIRHLPAHCQDFPIHEINMENMTEEDLDKMREMVIQAGKPKIHLVNK